MELNPVSHRIVADLLQARTGQYLGPARMWRINSALSDLFRQHRIENVEQLVCLLAAPGSDDLAREVVEALLNNETYFFRDKQMFDQIGEAILPELARRREGERRLRIWSAGCSSGQELLSIAMLIQAQKARFAGWRIELLGTDISTRIIAAASKARYTQFEVQRGLGVAQMLSYFSDDEKGWQVTDDLRKMVRFEVRNLLDTPPAGGPFDLILCRNVLLYFDPANRGRAFARLGEAMADDGYLMLGAGETVVGQTQVFDPAPRLSGLYCKAGGVRNSRSDRMARTPALNVVADPARRRRSTG